MSKKYLIERNQTTAEVTVIVREDGKEDKPLRHYERHSPTGFNYGYGGSGPAELARCILIDWFGNMEEGELLYQDFKGWFIAPAKNNLFHITDEMIEDWLAAQVNPGKSNKRKRKYYGKEMKG